ncbi:hypothetical protein M2475_001630 [Breznakia sp. PF5-3]|uniref:hypothetical protein n=1 Tax=unclassified Breznakia TaxID=2623764 RepID=UPI002406BF32|nr:MULTISPECIES: hypothetical protein [unclassified Breznakia]MDF9825196.1 hypothetical protein [Breznakia sp. PM6-1]MDF9836054.1 hypothetical protein [Breznakia sp. PF5-3]MDF9838870.1 hypothetical protein [Breznakia sp. PFB2-8]MDF9860896.1 hypothetical protein [Breznakia sp. PH5-24]
MKLQPYVYRNLKQFGNCVVDYKVVHQYGKQRIIDYLVKEGFEVILITNYDESIKSRNVKNATYILELIGTTKIDNRKGVKK